MTLPTPVPLDPSACAAGVTLGVDHETAYRYDSPVELAHHLGYLRPLSDACQVVEDYALAITPAPSDFSETLDGFGNARCTFALVAPHESLTVRATSRVTVHARFDGLDPTAGLPWEAAAQRLRYDPAVPFAPEAEFTFPSTYVPRHAELREYALLSFTPGRPVADAALDLMHRIHADFSYQPAHTQVSTPVLHAFQERVGVCQDFAHVMIGCLRAIGLAARYVSGYLMSQPPPGKPRLVGADASHAWVSVHCAGVPANAGWVDLDPTNDVVPGTAHVILAYGRDYGDVTPLRGVIRGGGHELDVRVTVAPIDEFPDGTDA
ncbi:transglutaminase family protein [Achromobacter sp. UMC46]|uniref:transglutaminase family protein n=1 Tax=Achromobacter sp. UMC46 TaxID=1862319 RepID=UPI0016012127|nr:transglutaminase family protein [Achromobacter sp. UMC46]